LLKIPDGLHGRDGMDSLVYSRDDAVW